MYNLAMKKLGLFVVLVAAIFTLISCAGANNDAPSPFQGNFTGTWISNATDSGTASINITAEGTFSGDETDTTINLHGVVSGHINSNGTFVGTIHPDGGGSTGASGVFQLTNGNTTLSGQVSSGGVNYTYTLHRV